MKELEKQKNNQKNFPMILIILDGWGLAEPNKGNAIALAKTPTMDDLTKNYAFTSLEASAKHVGLPPSQDGNSEAGHMNIGAGRIAEQDVVRISKNINNGTFFKNPAFMEAIRHVEKNNSRIHLMGMLANNMSAHSDPDHLLALLTLLKKKGIKNVNLHLFTDGRDSPKYSSIKLIRELERSFTNGETINTIIGRFFAMDRKKKWSRTEKAYDALVLEKSGQCKNAVNAETAIMESYNSGKSDEFIEPYIIAKNNTSLPRIQDNDSVIFFNLRSDRARQIAKVFVQDDFNKKNPGAFKRKKVLKNLRFVAMTDFGPDLDHILSAFPSPDLVETLPMQLSDLRQLYIAENEKYAHVTYFFNGGFSDPVANEARMLISSPDVKSYDETPAMSSEKLTDTVIENLKLNKFDFTVLNFAAPDMIGHTGNLTAAIECCEAVDKCLKKIVDAYLKVDGTLLVTADHGNIEEMINLKTGEINTEHTTNQVPFIIVNKDSKNMIKLRKDGVLGDIAPTVLHLLGRERPKDMTRKSLII
ncbi:MAG: 2,3-bisphosphoglycerate-independent phosphoglycerate mutase [Parcubacteria group bacterium GW2011_GWE2_39_37]|uniref:2,3-bisphosphoglycerate-independent phosphoglycerate mutase n=1 Tax=Candidatus Falkowbacteria bacterium GW2011_GWF2_39_8 TaxID=1618642 RepID=A0A0G0S8S4_9BACT|nr:MAG: 2,3-bisphosphoglycerate-independent phosphoglycerate mutase [Parcubacteria group bacterium GW2011_GWE2_39_37]KKR31135.1 MAG: 2,3-bisphosphoglycerate-independent phosphoglycerate mutase [Candidatus Falkowbacteria bacterium GW2011_GWF2_39_8]